MEIKILRRMEYKNTFIYIMQINYAFQYLFSWNREIYQQYAILPTRPFQKLKFKLGFSKTLFSQEELQVAQDTILTGAIDSIDALIAIEKSKKEIKETPKEVGVLSNLEFMKK